MCLFEHFFRRNLFAQDHQDCTLFQLFGTIAEGHLQLPITHKIISAMNICKGKVGEAGERSDRNLAFANIHGYHRGCDGWAKLTHKFFRGPVRREAHIIRQAVKPASIKPSQ